MADNKTSIYAGVSKNKTGTYSGVVTEGGKKIRLKMKRETEKEAAMDRDIYIIQNNLNPRKPLNFPRESYKDIAPMTNQELHPKSDEPVELNQFKSKIEPFEGSTVRLVVESNPDAFVIIDIEDAKNVCLYRWYVTDRGYVRTTLSGGLKIELHRFLTNPEEGKVVDHIDRNKLNNSKANLRIVTPGENGQNQPLRPNRTTKYRGVHLKNGKYIVRVNDVYVGSFDAPMIAAMQHDRYVINKGLHMVELNFKSVKEDYLAEENYEIPKYKKETKYDGVYCRNGPAYKDKPYKAEHKTRNKRIFIWESANEEECARKWDEYVIKNGLNRRRLNFPDEHPINPKAVKTKTLFTEYSENTYRLLIGNAPEAEVLIDKDQYDKVKIYKWTIVGDRIIARLNHGEKLVKLKRIIMDETDPNVDIKYKTPNKFDNRISNLCRVK